MRRDKPRPVRTSPASNFDSAGQNAKDILLPSDNTASTFWITNPDNTYRDNVAAGSDSTGFWFALPENPTGKFEGTEIGKATWPRRTKVREFKGNTSHSNFDGFLFDRGPRPDGHFATGGHMSLSIPLTRTALKWSRSSRISPATRTAIAASGAAVRCTCTRT